LLACFQLDEIRANYAGLDALLQDVAEDEAMRLRGTLSAGVLSEYTLLYLPQIGFLCRLPNSDETSPTSPPSNAMSGFEFKFKTDTHVFFKTRTAIQFDEEYGDLQGVITDLENNIVRQVQEQILELGDVIRDISERIAELDW
jgi:DNA mismatch repair ATPase MutS